MILEGSAVVIREDNVDTDVLYPGAYLNLADPEQMKPYLFEGLDPTLRDQLRGETILVVGENFGTGSSREHVPHAMLAWGVRCVLGKSFARIFFRNCINLGLPAIVCPDAVAAAEPGAVIRIDTDAGAVTVGAAPFRAAPLPPFMRDMLASGGLVDWARRRLAQAG
ncbi:MAG: 3-isopropylmalate dehydratase small subunit [Sphaerobacter sp.]|nr:3-isopropylmalate dehydratase small subunit [Sphaerobacter sp.]